eukprot:scaffold88320_cov43-Prasinocladus_malaysianus.AAC.2
MGSTWGFRRPVSSPNTPRRGRVWRPRMTASRHTAMPLGRRPTTPKPNLRGGPRPDSPTSIPKSFSPARQSSEASADTGIDERRPCLFGDVKVWPLLRHAAAIQMAWYGLLMSISQRHRPFWDSRKPLWPTCGGTAAPFQEANRGTGGSQGITGAGRPGLVSFGVHDSEEEAARQYDRALIIEKGERAKTNFPLTDYVVEVEEYENFLVHRHGTDDVSANGEVLETSRRCILPFDPDSVDANTPRKAGDAAEAAKRGSGGSKATVIYAEQLREAINKLRVARA